MSDKTITIPVVERWITQIAGGRIELVSRISDDSFVLRVSDLPLIAANRDFVSDGLAAEIVAAIRGRS